MASSLAAVWSLLAPTRCLACGVRADPPWCPACAAQAPPARDGCPRCADPWPGHRCPFLGGPIVATRAAWSHRGVVRDVIVGAKARNAWAGWEAHGLVLARLVQSAGWHPDAVVGVPSDPVAARRRGIDHGARLAAATAEALGLPWLRVLRARRGRADQATSGGGRARELAPDAFACDGPATGNVLLVDDVLTTGATAASAAAALLRGGAQQVCVAVLARAGAEVATVAATRDRTDDPE